MNSNMVKFDFYGDDIEVVKDDQDLWVSVRRICESLGIDRKSQQTKLKNKQWARRVIFTLPDSRGHKQDAFCIHIDTLPMWLATIDSSRVAETVRTKLLRYQKEATDVLRDYFYGGIAINPRAVEEKNAMKRHIKCIEIAMMLKDKGFLTNAYVNRYLQFSMAALQRSEVGQGERIIDVTGYLRGKGVKNSKIKKVCGNFGKLIKALYMSHYGTEPKKITKFVNKSERKVYCYTERDINFFDKAYETMFGPKN